MWLSVAVNGVLASETFSLLVSCSTYYFAVILLLFQMGFLLSKNNGAMRRTELGHADARSLILKTESEIPEA